MISAGDHVLVFRGAGEKLIGISCHGPMASGDLIMLARTADERLAGVFVEPMTREDDLGIICRTADERLTAVRFPYELRCTPGDEYPSSEFFTCEDGPMFFVQGDLSGAGAAPSHQGDRRCVPPRTIWELTLAVTTAGPLGSGSCSIGPIRICQHLDGETVIRVFVHAWNGGAVHFTNVEFDLYNRTADGAASCQYAIWYEDFLAIEFGFLTGWGGLPIGWTHIKTFDAGGGVDQVTTTVGTLNWIKEEP